MEGYLYKLDITLVGDIQHYFNNGALSPVL